MSCTLSTNDRVPTGAFDHVIAGDRPSPAATPGAAWVYFTGIVPPSGNPATVIVIGDVPPGCCAGAFAVASRTMADAVENRVRMNSDTNPAWWPRQPAALLFSRYAAQETRRDDNAPALAGRGRWTAHGRDAGRSAEHVAADAGYLWQV